LAWNKLFNELFALPFQLKVGQHVSDFVRFMEESDSIRQRAADIFTIAKLPPVDIELLSIPHKTFGKIQVRKIATLISDDHSRPCSWVVELCILKTEKKKQEASLWAFIKECLTRQQASSPISR
jgi:hypothetical protein